MLAMPLTVYIYPKCSTCQKALRFLERQGIDYQKKDIVITPPTIQELRRMLINHEGRVSKLFNTSGQVYRQLNLNEKLVDISVEDALTLLANNGMLIKRPFMISKAFGTVGFNESTWRKILL